MTTRFLAASALSSLGLFCLPTLAMAQSATVDGQPVVAAEQAEAPIVVTGVRQAYRGDFALSEIPQSIDVIDAGTIEENSIIRLNDALDLNASVARQNTLGGLWDSFAIRGFAGDENIPTGYLVNGFNGGRGFGGERDTAGIERIEVLKGPAAALFGRGEPGGTVNLVTKQARIGDIFGTFGVQFGSFDRLRSEADINLAVTEGLSARLIGYIEGATRSAIRSRNIVGVSCPPSGSPSDRIRASPTILRRPAWKRLSIAASWCWAAISIRSRVTAISASPAMATILRAPRAIPCVSSTI